MPEDSQAAFPAVIRKTPGVIGGDACIGTRRIAVWMLVQAKQLGLSDDEIRNRYEQPLSEAELAAAWEYYAAIARRSIRPFARMMKLARRWSKSLRRSKSSIVAAACNFPPAGSRSRTSSPTFKGDVL